MGMDKKYVGGLVTRLCIMAAAVGALVHQEWLMREHVVYANHPDFGASIGSLGIAAALVCCLVLLSKQQNEDGAR